MSLKANKDFSILLVDDEPIFRNLLSLSFQRSGFQVVTAEAGKEAFEIFRNHPVDAVITDIRMPNGDGIELLDRLKVENPQIPVVLYMTGFNDISITDARKKGAEGIFCKPLDPKLLEDMIYHLLLSETLPNSPLEALTPGVKAQFRFPGLDWIESCETRVTKKRLFAPFPETLLSILPNVNEKVSFKIQLKENRPFLEGEGVVKFVRTRATPNQPIGYGIDFTQLGDLEKKELEVWLQGQRQDQHQDQGRKENRE